MAMTTGSSHGVRSEINITPLVDVVLVLLIIFMVVTPLTQAGYDVQVPPERHALMPTAQQDQLIVRIDAEGRTFLNREQVPYAEFGTRLRQAMTHRAGGAIFFAADGNLPYARVADFMDLCRDNGAENLGIVFDDLQASVGL